MKTLSGTFTFVVLTVIGIVAVFTFRVLAQGSGEPSPAVVDKKFVLKIGGPTKEDYAEVTSEAAFKAALGRLGKDQYHIRFKDDSGKITDPYYALSIKTDKVTTSELAKSAATGELTSIGRHVTIKVTSDNVADLTEVLKALK
jgi:hypothetical protein